MFIHLYLCLFVLSDGIDTWDAPRYYLSLLPWIRSSPGKYRPRRPAIRMYAMVSMPDLARKQYVTWNTATDVTSKMKLPLLVVTILV